jgi:hypothetical protein
MVGFVHGITYAQLPVSFFKQAGKLFIDRFLNDQPSRGLASLACSTHGTKNGTDDGSAKRQLRETHDPPDGTAGAADTAWCCGGDAAEAVSMARIL